MTDTTDCTRNFILNLLKDLGKNSFQSGFIGIKLAASLKAFNDNKPDTTLTQISDELYNCVKPHINNSAIVTGEEIAFLIIYFSIITAITVILVVIIIATF